MIIVIILNLQLSSFPPPPPFPLHSEGAPQQKCPLSTPTLSHDTNLRTGRGWDGDDGQRCRVSGVVAEDMVHWVGGGGVGCRIN